MIESPTITIAPGFADSNPLSKMFKSEFQGGNIHNIPVPGHPNTNPTETQYWISAFWNEAVKILLQTQPDLVVTNSIHTIETLSKIKELEEAWNLNGTRIASFAPAFDVVTTVVNMYNRACGDKVLRNRENILSGDESIYERLMKLVKNGQWNSQEFCKDLNYYNENPELFFELVEHFRGRIKILLNPNDRIIFSWENNSFDQRIQALKPIRIEWRGKWTNTNRDALFSHIVGKSVSTEVSKLKTWVS